MQEIQCRAILFDLDGVLVDSTEVVERQWCIWAEHHRFPCEVILAHAHGRRTIDTLRAIASHLHQDLAQEAALLEKREFVDHRAWHATGRCISASALSHQKRSSCILASGITHEE